MGVARVYHLIYIYKRISKGELLDTMKSRCDSPGPSDAMADKRSKLTTGPDSGAGAQPTGGLAGGDMRNCLTGGGI